MEGNSRGGKTGQMRIGKETEIWNESLKVKLRSDCEFGIPTVRGQNLPHQHFPGAQFAGVKVKVKRWKLERESCKRERKRERWKEGGVTVNCVGVEAKRSSTLDLSALGCSALHRAVSKESTARQTLPPVKTFHKIFPRKTLSGIQHEWKLRYSYLQRRKLLCAHCWKDVFQACPSSENVAKKILNRSARI